MSFYLTFVQCVKIQIGSTHYKFNLHVFVRQIMLGFCDRHINFLNLEFLINDCCFFMCRSHGIKSKSQKYSLSHVSDKGSLQSICTMVPYNILYAMKRSYLYIGMDKLFASIAYMQRSMFAIGIMLIVIKTEKCNQLHLVDLYPIFLFPCTKKFAVFYAINLDIGHGTQLTCMQGRHHEMRRKVARKF